MAADDRDDGAPDTGAPEPDSEPAFDPDEPIDAQPGSAETEIQSFPPVPPARPVGPGSTRIMPPVDDGGPPTAAGRPPGESVPVWSARAQVPTPPDVYEDDHAGWVEPPRANLMPVLVTVCALLLIALAGLGVWLIFADRSGSNSPAPGPASPASSAAPAPRSAAPTSSTPAAVALPDLRGLDAEAAVAKLRQLGFVPQRRDQSDAQIAAGKVIGTDPPVGSVVIPGATIGLLVSTGPATPATSPAAPTTTPGPRPT